MRARDIKTPIQSRFTADVTSTSGRSKPLVYRLPCVRHPMVSKVGRLQLYSLRRQILRRLRVQQERPGPGYGVTFRWPWGHDQFLYLVGSRKITEFLKLQLNCVLASTLRFCATSNSTVICTKVGPPRECSKCTWRETESGSSQRAIMKS
ncbi:uncharacterized protein EI97DRAFT_125287 [Westerdykella ornata]|uniref:Uncharacterized protein n=1 Tax=Westerdykella ornata TaxID=318751 RepID=A0A6A6JWU4_WESOR|nr:uncharacterized protein EI97DRAFT_125287 [Westerdykella ornata]KAF2280543.1 hypothetical protein EI97DRAFT_125287 [Westerdykella ornata]